MKWRYRLLVAGYVRRARERRMARPLRYLDAAPRCRHTFCMTKAAQARINARLPPDVAQKVAYLSKRTGSSTTDVLLASIEYYYAAVTTSEASSAQTLAGFVGCADGPHDLSSSYKNELTRSLRAKS
jgi:hypothetical protein